MKKLKLKTETVRVLTTANTAPCSGTISYDLAGSCLCQTPSRVEE